MIERAIVIAVLAGGCAPAPASSPEARDAVATDQGLTDQGVTDQGVADQGVTDADAAIDPRVAHVLFVGNSYVFVGDLPAQLHSLGTMEVTVESVSVGGATLKMHYESTGSLAKIREAKWTHVVVQGQSVEPLFDPANFHTYAAKLASEIGKAGAKPVFYETWARRAGDKVYAETWSGGDPAAMQAKLRAAYEKAATDNGGLIARVGDAREKALEKTFSFSLFDPDGSHPSLEGAYLGACVFFSVVTGRPSFGRPTRPAGMSEVDAKTLQAIADGVSK